MANAEIHQKDVLEFFDNRLHDESRYLYPVTPRESVEAAIVRRFQQLQTKSESITLVDGAFDVPHNNHEWYLRHCKLIGAFAAHKVADLPDISFEDFAMRIRRDKSLLKRHKLAVTVDADEKIASKKSGLINKGGIQRPVYPWQARADRLAGYHFSHDNNLYQTVDLVTVEGDGIHCGTPLESSLALAAFLKSEQLLDSFIVYSEHSSTVDEAENLHLSPIIISDDVMYEANPQTGERWSSSDIIRRAQGNSVAVPITRPINL